MLVLVNTAAAGIAVVDITITVGIGVYRQDFVKLVAGGLGFAKLAAGGLNFAAKKKQAVVLCKLRL